MDDFNLYETTPQTTKENEQRVQACSGQFRAEEYASGSGAGSSSGR